MSHKTVLLLVGGRSGEHEISLISGKHVYCAIDKKKFKTLIIVIGKNGELSLVTSEALAGVADNPRIVKTPQGTPVTLKPSSEKPSLFVNGKEEFYDIAFPLLHGPGGEDGSVQGIFEFSGVPLVGNGVKSSALCMDKGWTKTLARLKGVPVVEFMEVFRGQDAITSPWSFPIFVKPAHLGSSLGVSKVKRAEDFPAALEAAFKMDEKVLIEPAITGREIEVAILGKRGHLKASAVGEIRPRAEFYTYDAKYVDEDGAELLAPAPLDAGQAEVVQNLAKRVFDALECRGMARIDFFLTPKGNFLLNEINTIPGFTTISMYPKLFQLTGLSYAQLVTELIESAL